MLRIFNIMYKIDNSLVDKKDNFYQQSIDNQELKIRADVTNFVPNILLMMNLPPYELRCYCF